ncbi:MAG: LPS export ABC transporter permease LptF [Gammaproteobacteria bacterium]|nr:LPS export ABC transporter permease LptF [Gammaproteobacteria bacterium]
MILNRYIIKEVLFTLTAVTSVLLLFFISDSLVRSLAKAAAGILPSDIVVQLLMLYITDTIEVLLPISLYLSVLLALGRFYQDNEMTALEACGVSTLQISKSIFWFALFVALLTATFSFYIAPWAERGISQLKNTSDTSTQLRAIIPGQFKELSGWALYVEKIEPSTSQLKNIFVEGTHEGQLQILAAQSAHERTLKKSGDQFLVLESGYQYAGVPGTTEFTVTKFQEHGIRIHQKNDPPPNHSYSTKTPFELLAINNPRSIAELQWRISIPLSTLLLALLAIPLSRTTPRQGKYSKLVVGILLFIVYSNLLVVAKSWVEKGDVSVWIGLWWVHGLVILLITILFIKQNSPTFLKIRFKHPSK